MRIESLLRLTVAPPGPTLALIWPLFLALGLLGFWGGRRRPWLAVVAALAVAALGAELVAEARRDAPRSESGGVATVSPDWRSAYAALGLGVLLVSGGLWRARSDARGGDARERSAA